MNKNSRLVYSTDKGRIRPEKSPDGTQPVNSDGIIRVGRETKGRNGKGVTIVSGFAMKADELKKMAKKLKQLCGTGGTAKDQIIEIQGDQREKILDYLNEHGFTAKRSGG